MMEASIIIPTYNRAEKLRSCLQALASQTQPITDFEVIVVVDGSTDNTLEMLGGLQTPFALRVMQQANCGQTRALNRGAVEAFGRICVFLDDDIVVVPNFVSEHLRLHQERDLVVGIGQITMTMPSDADWFARGFARSWKDHYAELNRGKRQPDWDDCYGGNMSVPRAPFLAVGGNATDLPRGYDVDLAYRLKQYGCSFEYLPEALGEQFENKGLRELSRDAELAGEGSVELARRYPETRQKLFGHFADNRPNWILLWRLFLITNLSARGMDRLQRFAGKGAETFEWFAFFYNYYFWMGVRRATAHDNTLKQIIDFKKRGYLA
jgi:glycosyltransferase involved in cell wall biosynthesis